MGLSVFTPCPRDPLCWKVLGTDTEPAWALFLWDCGLASELESHDEARCRLWVGRGPSGLEREQNQSYVQIWVPDAHKNKDGR